jgi:hypothetical protein
VFIQEMMFKHPNCPVVWLDADAEVVAYPELLFKMKADVAAGFKGDEFLSGTLYLKNNVQVRSMVNSWIEDLARRNGPSPACTEQLILKDIIIALEHQELITFQRLPFEYVKIFDVNHDKATVILHHQLSRQGRH